MKIVLGVTVLVLSGLVADAELQPIQISSLVVTGNQAVLQWTGGRSNYQVQTRADFISPWSNLGAPTTSLSTIFPVTNQQAFYRIVSDFTAQYRVTFNATWSQQTLPTNWPAGAHFSGLVGGTHNSSVHFWRDGEIATEGIRLMAELGQKTTLLNEIAPAITNGAAHLQLSGGGISPSPGSVSLTFPAPMRRDFPLVTLVSMIAPSPDWFVGVDSLDLLENDQWATNKVVTLYGKDAGTDSGSTYSSPDQPTVPRGVITQFTGFPALQDGVIVPFGKFTFTRLD